MRLILIVMFITDTWTEKDTLNVVIGIALSFITAFAYECFINWRKYSKERKEFSFLESADEHVWQHYDIDTGKITVPVDAFMHLRYIGDKKLKFTWFKADKKLLGEGYITWEDGIHGKMSAHEYLTSSYRYRNVFYREIQYNDQTYDAIFVNADDEGGKYVMLRSVAFRPS
jgi:hypothetical protein